MHSRERATSCSDRDGKIGPWGDGAAVAIPRSVRSSSRTCAPRPPAPHRNRLHVLARVGRSGVNGPGSLPRVRDYFEQVRRVAKAGLYFVTLEATLVIPDMCAGMETANGWTTGQLYTAWFDKHVAPKYVAAGQPSLSGDDCWGLRCAMLHQGRLEPHGGAYSRIIFIEPHGGIRMHNNVDVTNRALNIDVTQFAIDMVESAEQWLVAAEQTPNYQANYPHFMQRYPNGLAPFIAGLAVIA